MESRYWRILALHHLAEGKPEEALEAEEKALEKGLPLAHLFNERGKLLYQKGRSREAIESFQKAVGSKPDLTDAARNLRDLSGASAGSKLE